MWNSVPSVLSTMYPAAPQQGADQGSFWLPPAASTLAEKIDPIFGGIFWLSVFFFVAITAVAIYFFFRYRRKHPDQQAEPSSPHHDGLEITWTVIPTLICVVLFAAGALAYVEGRRAPAEAMEVQVTARKWSWEFTYPNGHTDSELHAPVDRPVTLVMRSEDVLHSFYVPAFRIKMDVVPGRYTTAWFEATDAGEYTIYCTEYCGTQHSAMLSKVVVHEPGGYEKWLEESGDLLAKLPPAEAGKVLYEKKGCAQCHSLTGARGIGPSFKGAWDQPRKFAGGSAGKFDANYVRESVLNPQAKIVEGYAPVMPTYQGKLSDGEISALVAFMKSL